MSIIARGASMRRMHVELIQSNCTSHCSSSVGGQEAPEGANWGHDGMHRQPLYKGGSMRLIHRRHGLVLFFMLAFALVGFRAPTAQAASENGAYVLNVQECNEYEGDEYEGDEYEGYTECITAKGVVNEIITPSGNTSFVTNDHYSVSVTNPEGNVVFAKSVKSQYHSLTRDDDLREFRSRIQATFNIDGELCTASYAFHEVNGEVQFEREEYTCSAE